LDINAIPWEAQFFGQEDLEKQRAKIEKTFEKLGAKDDPVWKPPPGFYTFLDVTSKPHWWVTGATRDDNGCSWVVREEEGVIYAIEG